MGSAEEMLGLCSMVWESGDGSWAWQGEQKEQWEVKVERTRERQTGQEPDATASFREQGPEPEGGS